MVTDAIDKIIRTGEYDYIIKNCKTEEELKDRLYDVLLTDVRVTGNATRDSSYHLTDALQESTAIGDRWFKLVG